MALLQTIAVILIVSTGANCRGPHHPRGESVIKHHVHYRPTKGEHNEKITQDEQLLHDKEHIREELEEWIVEKDIEAMTPEELEFHYFNIHDFDRNKHLDGLEMLQAIRHTEQHFENEDEHMMLLSAYDIEYYIDLIDEVLQEDDLDEDGLLSYPEYVTARKKDNGNNPINDLQLGFKEN